MLALLLSPRAGACGDGLGPALCSAASTVGLSPVLALLLVSATFVCNFLPVSSDAVGTGSALEEAFGVTAAAGLLGCCAAGAAVLCCRLAFAG